MEEDTNLSLCNSVGDGDTKLKEIQRTPPQDQDCSRERRNNECLGNFSFDDIFFQQEKFTFTGLLQGEIDTLYSKPNSYSFMQDTVNLTATGSFSGPQASSFENAPSQDLGTACDQTNTDSTFHLPSENDPWTDSLFQNIELDEVYDGRPDDVCDQEYRCKNHAEPISASQLQKQNEDSGRELCEKDIDEFLEDEETASQGQASNSVDKNLIPQVGMQFKTREEAQNFFNLYAYAVGFSMVIVSAARTTSIKRNREVIRVTVKCNKFGTNTTREEEQQMAQRQCTVIDRTGCKVEMVISERQGVWRITNLCLDHNHELSPQSKYFRSHIYMSNEEKALIRSLRQANITTSKIVSVLSFLRGGPENTPYNKKKVSNYGTKVNREFKNCDVMQVVQYFKKKRAEDNGFYYSFKVGKNNKVKSVFWADAKARSYYETCGDCISFDTTFLTNKYNLPFAPIVGVSPHGNTYLFACALLCNETAGSFKWVFEEFLCAMGGKHPQTIITDQDRGMQVAISQVFPNTVHKSCLFHVKSKAEDTLCPTFKANEGLYEEFQDIIDNSLTEQEFETLWTKMIEDYQVGHIEFFQTMWKNRKKFVPVYFKKSFSPFLKTTARSEGTNSLFKRGVGAQYSMTSFLREYQRIMDSIHSRENECEHNAIHKTVPPEKLMTKYYIEMQAHDLYNISIFRKFQKILNDITRLRLKEEKPGQLYLVFQAQNYPIKEHRPRTYLVHVDLEKEEYHCICCKFEKDGLVCSHILKVMVHMDIEKIPDKYIIDRWRKKNKMMHPLPIPDKLADNDTLRYNLLARRLVKTASKGATHNRKYEYLLAEIDRVEDGLDAIEKEIKKEMEEEDAATRTLANFANPLNGDDADSVIELGDPDDAHTKGRPRMMTIREAIKAKRFYKCSHCGSTEHTIKKCTNMDKEYNLPKPKRTRRKKKDDSAARDVDSSSSAPKKKKTGGEKAKPSKKSMQESNNVVQQNSSEQTSTNIQAP